MKKRGGLFGRILIYNFLVYNLQVVNYNCCEATSTWTTESGRAHPASTDGRRRAQRADASGCASSETDRRCLRRRLVEGG